MGQVKDRDLMRNLDPTEVAAEQPYLELLVKGRGLSPRGAGAQQTPAVWDWICISCPFVCRSGAGYGSPIGASGRLYLI
jgi:hypothetical protein